MAKNTLTFMAMLWVSVTACTQNVYSNLFGIGNGWNTGCNIVLCAENDGIVIANNLFDYDTGNAVQLQKRNFGGGLVWEEFHDLNTGCACGGCFGTLVKDGHMGGYALGTLYWDGIQDGPDCQVIKFDENGQEVWRRTHGIFNEVDAPLHMSQTSDGGYILAGYSQPNGYSDLVNRNSEIYIMRLDAMGNLLWDSFVPSTGNNTWERSRMIWEDPLGGYILGGFTAVMIGTTDDHESADGFISKLDDAGNELWRKWFTTPYLDFDVSVTPSKFGGYILWQGEGFQYQHNTELDKLCYVAFLDETGQNEWWRTYFDTIDQTKQIRMVKQLEDGSLIAAGYSGASTSVQPLWGWMAKLAFSGEILWERVYYYYNLVDFVGQHPNEVTRNSYLTDVVATPDGGYMATGTYRIYDDTTYVDKTNYAWLLKVDGMGCLEPGCNTDSVFVSTADLQLIPLSGSPQAFMRVRPNPVRAGTPLHVDLWQANTGSTFRLYDLHGRQLAQRQVKAGETGFELPLPDTSPGVLLCVLEDAQGRVAAQQKVVVLGR